MIKAEFYKRNNSYHGFSVSGHADYADFGQDIVCAGVTSALQLTANAITEVLEINAVVDVFSERIVLSLPEHTSETAQYFIEAFRIQLVNLAEDYPKRISITDLEV